MPTRNGFTLLTLAEFEGWIAAQRVARTILTLQQHHTWSPAYAQFTGANHFELQAAMKRHHVTNNGWGDIGQHFTTFPDGTIMTGRPLEQTPACIKGQNAHSVCVEHLGNFDAGRDTMSAAHRASIIGLSGAICRRFAIPVNVDRIVYHHWFHLDTGARTNGSGNTKTCPGTAFFGGNSVESAQRTFLPHIRSYLGGAEAARPAARPAGIRYGVVTTDTLNVRRGANASATKVNAVTLGSIVRIHDERDGWLRLSASQQEWVSARFVSPVERATVNADTLHVRSGPGQDFGKLAALARNQEVFVHERTNGWCRIGLESRWVSEAFLTAA
ncbi:MAG: SH3 domain-containing protein [Gemmatimonas sp.]|jgi:uncharacterized protein YraI|uniref:SH3 domain-containing protein n=1 Tax=Gemmatimonas sp. TaxID=1962908 RepID=UPI00391FAB9A